VIHESPRIPSSPIAIRGDLPGGNCVRRISRGAFDGHCRKDIPEAHGSAYDWRRFRKRRPSCVA
jgi:hypothetical protein